MAPFPTEIPFLAWFSVDFGCLYFRRCRKQGYASVFAAGWIMVYWVLKVTLGLSAAQVQDEPVRTGKRSTCPQQPHTPSVCIPKTQPTATLPIPLPTPTAMLPLLPSVDIPCSDAGYTSQKNRCRPCHSEQSGYLRQRLTTEPKAH